MLDLSTVEPNVHEEHPRDLPECNDDPEPPRCAQPGHENAIVHRRDCLTCGTYRRWRERQYDKKRRGRSGSRRFTDLSRLTDHIDALETAGMIIPDVARVSQLSPQTLWRIRSNAHAWVSSTTAERLLSVPIPERRKDLVPNSRGDLRRRVDATGTHRRIRCAQRAGHPLADLAAQLGWGDTTVDMWLGSPTVSVDAADAVAALFPRLIAEPGTNNQARAIAAAKGYPEARYFSEANIDDPAYDPFQMIRHAYGVVRRLRALAVIAQGPAQVAARIGEPTEAVRQWMERRPAPAYALHLVAEDYERWCTTQGPDQEAADLARHMDWPSALAWDDVDIDSPTAQPRRTLPTGTPTSSLVLHTMVLNALDGKVTAAELMSAEREQVVWILHRRRWSDRRIAAWLRWNPAGDHDKGRAAVLQFRLNHDITGYGPTEFGHTDDTGHGLIVVPADAQLAGVA